MTNRGALSVLLPLLVSLLASACRENRPAVVRVVPQLEPIRPRRVVFAPDEEDRLLILEATGLVGVWDVRDPDAPVRTAWIPAGAIDAVFSRDGREVIAAGWDGKVRWWDRSGQWLRTSQGGHRGAARALAVVAPSTDGGSPMADVVVSGGEDGTLRAWNRDGTARGEPIAAHDGIVVSVAMRANGDLASSGTDESIRLWEKDTSSPSGYRGRVLDEPLSAKRRQQLAHLLKMDANMGWDRALGFSPRTGDLAGANFDGSARLWRAGEGAAPRMLDVPGGRLVRSVAWTASGETVATTGFDGNVTLWTEGRPGRIAARHQAPVVSVAFSPSGRRFATACMDDRVRLWGSDGKPIVELRSGEPRSVMTAKVASQQVEIAAADASGVRRWRLGGGAPAALELGRADRALALAFSPRDDTLAIGGAGGKLLSWKPGATPVALAPTIGSYIDEVAFSRDGRVLSASGTAGRTQLLHLDGSARGDLIRACQEVIYGMDFQSAGEHLVVVCESGSVKLWTREGTQVRTILEPERGAARGLGISSDGRLLASGGLDGVLRLWTLPGLELETVDVGLAIQQVGLHPDGSWASANGDTVLFFDRARKLVATAVAARDALLVFTPDGWFAGSQDVERLVRLVDGNGRPLVASGTVERLAPDKVQARLTSG